MSESAAAPKPRGRGLVIAGAVIAGISVVITAAACIYFVTGVMESPEAMSMVFVFVLLGWLALATPSWSLGIVLLGIGRQQQRGPVRGHVAAWIIALGSLPLVGFLLSSAVFSGGSGNLELLFYALIVSIPLAIVGSLAAGAWLVWGKPGTSVATPLPT